MEQGRVDSGVFSAPAEVERRRVEPETVVILFAWVVALLYVAVGVVGGSGFGPDRAIALAFAIAVPILARGAWRQR